MYRCLWLCLALFVSLACMVGDLFVLVLVCDYCMHFWVMGLFICLGCVFVLDDGCGSFGICCVCLIVLLPVLCALVWCFVICMFCICFAYLLLFWVYLLWLSLCVFSLRLWFCWFLLVIIARDFVVLV